MLSQSRFPWCEDFPVKITGMNEVTISFQGKRPDGSKAVRRIDGTIDRVTSAVDAWDISRNLKTAADVSSTRYTLKCRPAQRMTFALRRQADPISVMKMMWSDRVRISVRRLNKPTNRRPNYRNLIHPNLIDCLTMQSDTRPFNSVVF
jgi:hypothetical protein